MPSLNSLLSRPERLSRSQSAFQRTDLAVCVAVILLLGAVGVAAFSRGEEDARLAKCRSNLKELHEASVAYSLTHGGNTPPAGPGSWPWYMSANTGNALVSLGARPENFYCPSSTTYRLLHEIWNFSSSSRVLGYVFLTPGAPSVPEPLIVSGTPRDPNRVVESQICTNYALPNASQRPYIVDATLSEGSNMSNRGANNYTSISATFFLPLVSTSHLRGQAPVGGNLMMLDGHVEWRDFERMRVRNNAGTVPAFWW